MKKQDSEKWMKIYKILKKILQYAFIITSICVVFWFFFRLKNPDTVEANFIIIGFSVNTILLFIMFALYQRSTRTKYTMWSAVLLRSVIIINLRLLLHTDCMGAFCIYSMPPLMETFLNITRPLLWYMYIGIGGAFLFGLYSILKYMPLSLIRYALVEMSMFYIVVWLLFITINALLWNNIMLGSDMLFFMITALIVWNLIDYFLIAKVWQKLVKSSLKNN